MRLLGSAGSYSLGFLPGSWRFSGEGKKKLQLYWAWDGVGRKHEEKEPISIKEYFFCTNVSPTLGLLCFLGVGDLSLVSNNRLLLTLSCAKTSLT